MDRWTDGWIDGWLVCRCNHELQSMPHALGTCARDPVWFGAIRHVHPHVPGSAMLGVLAGCKATLPREEEGRECWAAVLESISNQKVEVTLSWGSKNFL